MTATEKAPTKVHEPLKAKGELEAEFQAARDEQLGDNQRSPTAISRIGL